MRSDRNIYNAAPHLYQALRGLFDLVCILGYESGQGERPILKDGVADQKMAEARTALALADGEKQEREGA